MGPELLLLLLGGGTLLASFAPDGFGGDDADETVDGAPPQGTTIISSDDDGGQIVAMSGTERADTIFAPHDNSVTADWSRAEVEVFGLGGDDLIYSQDDGTGTTIHGGSGDDSILGASTPLGSETLLGENGDDTITAGGEWIDGGMGDDVLIAGGYNPYHNTSPLHDDDPAPGNDLITTYEDDATTLTGGAGNDQFTLTAGYWRHETGASGSPEQLVNDVLIRDFDAAEDKLVIPEQVGDFYSLADNYPEAGEVRNVSASLSDVEIEESGGSSLVTLTYLPDHDDRSAMTVTITLAGVTGLDLDSITYSDDAPTDYAAVAANAGLTPR